MKRIRVSVGGSVLAEREVDRELVIGRSERADIQVNDSEVSSRHLRVRPGANGFVVIDLGSTNGSFLDGETRLTPDAEVPFGRGQKLMVGPALVEVVETAADDPASSDFFGAEKTVAVGDGQMQSALIAVARFKAAAPRLVIAAEHDHRTVAVQEMECVIGRDPDAAQIEIRHGSVSAKHAVLSFAKGAFSLRDLGSSNGTFVDGNRVEGATGIQPQTVVTIGTVDCLFTCKPPESDDAAALSEALVNHAIAMNNATQSEARAVLAEHRESGRPLGELFVERGIMTPRVWVDLWRQRDVIRTLGSAAGAGGGTSKVPLLLLLLLIVAVAVTYMFVL